MSLHPLYICPLCQTQHGENTEQIQGEKLCQTCNPYRPTVSHKYVVDHTQHHDHSFGSQTFRSDGPPEECLGNSCWALIQVQNLAVTEAAMKKEPNEVPAEAPEPTN